MKEKFIKSTLILVIGGFFTKLLGMIIKIIMTRYLGDDGIGMYMMILPTFTLLICLSQFGMPIAFSKLVAEDKFDNKRLFSSIIPISFIINLILIILIIFSSKFLSYNLLNNKKLYYSIICMALVVPFTTISSICRSYFFGIQRMLPHVISNILEDLFRLLIMIFGLKYFLKYDISIVLSFLILINIISEVISTFVLVIFLPNKFSLKSIIKRPSKIYINKLMYIGFYNTITRLIGSIGYFFEPIILTNFLILNGFSNSYIIREYGIISGYVMPLLLMPSFFSVAISQALLPVVSHEYSIGNMKSLTKKIKFAVFISTSIGIFFTTLFMIFPSVLLKLIYNTNSGVLYVKVLAPFLLIHYMEAPLVVCLDAMGLGKINMKIIFISTISKTILLFIFSYLKLGLWSLVFSTGISIIISVFLCIKKVRQALLSYCSTKFI